MKCCLNSRCQAFLLARTDKETFYVRIMECCWLSKSSDLLLIMCFTDEGQTEEKEDVRNGDKGLAEL